MQRPAASTPTASWGPSAAPGRQSCSMQSQQPRQHACQAAGNTFAERAAACQQAPSTAIHCRRMCVHARTAAAAAASANTPHLSSRYTADEVQATSSSRLSALHAQLSTLSASTAPSRVNGSGSNVLTTSLKPSAADSRHTRRLSGSLTARSLQSGDSAGSAAAEQRRERAGQRSAGARRRVEEHGAGSCGLCRAHLRPQPRLHNRPPCGRPAAARRTRRQRPQILRRPRLHPPRAGSRTAGCARAAQRSQQRRSLLLLPLPRWRRLPAPPADQPAGVAAGALIGLADNVGTCTGRAGEARHATRRDPAARRLRQSDRRRGSVRACCLRPEIQQQRRSMREVESGENEWQHSSTRWRCTYIDRLAAHMQQCTRSV